MQLVHNADWGPDAPPAIPAPSPLSLIPDTGLAGPTLRLHAVARMLGVEARSERFKAAYVARLIAEEGFPAPLPMLVRGTLSRDIHPRKSCWPALAVRAWFLAQSPAHAVATVADAEALEAAAASAARLDAAAADLFADPRQGGAA